VFKVLFSDYNTYMINIIIIQTENSNISLGIYFWVYWTIFNVYKKNELITIIIIISLKSRNLRRLCFIRLCNNIYGNTKDVGMSDLFITS